MQPAPGIARRTVRVALGIVLLAAVGACAAPRGASTPGMAPQADEQAALAAYAVAAQRALEYLPDQASTRWTDPGDGRVLQLTVVATENGADGAVCRRVRVTAASRETMQRFCRDGDGRWSFAPDPSA